MFPHLVTPSPSFATKNRTYRPLYLPQILSKTVSLSSLTKVSQNEQETLRYHSHIKTLEGKLDDEHKRSHLEISMQSQKWSEFEKMAESMKNLSRSMTARSMSPET